MKTSSLLISFLVTFCFLYTGCSNQEGEPFYLSSELLMGYWVNPVTVDSCKVFERGSKFNPDTYGIVFKHLGQLEEHQNSGFCGTPPISYAIYRGTWSKKDSVITICSKYWGGEMNYKMTIRSVDQAKLIISKIEYLP